MTSCCISGVCDYHMARNDLLTDKMATVKSLAAQAEQAVLDMNMPDAVQCLRMLAETATSTLETAVLVGREQGLTWDEIGKWLGVTRQAAQQRFRDPTDTAAHRFGTDMHIAAEALANRIAPR